jgi:XTP/dITP diphosphohydrolase
VKLLYGTANLGKVDHMKNMLFGMGIEIISIKDIQVDIGEIEEVGNNPLDNAKIKALAYYQKARMPVFSCDSGLYIEGIDDAFQPGVHIRRVGGRVLNDEEMIQYYTWLASQFGGEVIAKYKNAIALILDENTMFAYDGDEIASESFILTSKAHEKRTHGLPLDSISLELNTRRYYLDISSSKANSDEKLTQGFLRFRGKSSVY